ncbi:isopenicillin N synthase family dioxygenase [Sphingomonas jatrophae]|uniref:2-oxoglutarate-dependent ethylene/succinate-forming enzyme n=1 Tax=Sphingomonas jatrophae TaxID=1166337 RepID=A0A1I6LCQ1_9SPHN|nr:2-oxoglutarate and iron-dependent oxygenase domain-containing protein [Sphingomonas jatrophae]SFS01262.1 Isopenicillin N synthase [Sphingomonas jatrophae]
MTDALSNDIADPATEQVASVSLAQADSDPDGFAAEIGRSFERYGFAVVRDHGVPAALIAEAEAASRAFFALPTEDKRAYHLPGTGGARGYIPFGIETAKGATHVDLKEFWHVGRELPEGHPFAEVMAPNLWPREVAGFRQTMLDLFAAFDAAGAKILSAIARHLGLAPDFFVDTVRDGNSVLRLLHYPPVPADAPGIRAGAHEDINTITLLLGAAEAGLQLKLADGRWLPIYAKEGELVVNIGDMLQRLTNHRLVSTSHRVMNPPPERRGISRYSMPFFLHFRPDYRIETLPQMVDADHPDRYPESITAHDFLAQRLREIKLA